MTHEVGVNKPMKGLKTHYAFLTDIILIQHWLYKHFHLQVGNMIFAIITLLFIL